MYVDQLMKTVDILRQNDRLLESNTRSYEHKMQYLLTERDDLRPIF